MAREHAFDGLAAALSWHPDELNTLWGRLRRSRSSTMRFRFIGRSSHASSDPYNGRSALDAVELMNVGVNYLREHMPSDARVHYALLDAGGIAPNVVQARAKVSYMIRARDLPELTRLTERYAI